MKKYLIFLTLTVFINCNAQKLSKNKFDKDLILYLPLNGNIVDFSVLKNKCTSKNIQPEKDKNNAVNGAFSFENNASINVENVENFNGLTSFTLSSWVYLNEYNEHNTIVSKANPGRDFNLQIKEEGIINFHTAYSYYTHFFSDIKVALHMWTHIVFTYDGSVFKLYINGKMDKLSTIEAVQDTPEKNLPAEFLWTGQDLTIGNLYPNAGENFRGRIDEVRIYKKALSANEILKLYKTNDKEKGVPYSLGDFNGFNEPIYKSVVEPNNDFLGPKFTKEGPPRSAGKE